MSSSKLLGQYQPNLTQSISHGWEFKFVWLKNVSCSLGKLFLKYWNALRFSTVKKEIFPQNHWDNSNGNLKEGFLSEGDSSC